MSLAQSTGYGFYFGNQSDNLCVNGRYEGAKFGDLHRKISKSAPIKKVVFLKQTHSADVIVLDDSIEDSAIKMHLFEQSGDAIVTNITRVAIGVVTADCVPLILYDPKHHAIAVIHAGWRGLFRKIISNTIATMKKAYQTNPLELMVHIGPSARVCCYEIGAEFYDYFPDADKQGLVSVRRHKIYFDPIKTAYNELLDNQILADHIDSSRQVCTICDENYCSFRREKEMAGRQPSLIYLT